MNSEPFVVQIKWSNIFSSKRFFWHCVLASLHGKVLQGADQWHASLIAGSNFDFLRAVHRFCKLVVQPRIVSWVLMAVQILRVQGYLMRRWSIKPSWLRVKLERLVVRSSAKWQKLKTKKNWLRDWIHEREFSVFLHRGTIILESGSQRGVK